MSDEQRDPLPVPIGWIWLALALAGWGIVALIIYAVVTVAGLLNG